MMRFFFTIILFSCSSGMKIEVGDKAPDFDLPDQFGNIVKISSYKGKRHIVLYFYPKDDTPGCTAEAIAFRDSYADFKDVGAEIIGISRDDEESHRAFMVKCDLPFILLSDTDGKVRKLYGVSKTLGLISARVTFVIDKEGVIRHIFSSHLNPTKHVAEAMRFLKGSVKAQ